MAPDDPPPSDPRTMVADVLLSPAGEYDRLPALLGLLDEGNRQVRFGAVAALCTLANEHESLVPYLSRRLLDRVTADRGLEAGLALEYLAARFPEEVEQILNEHASGDARETQLRDLETDLGRATLYGSSSNTLDLGRTRLPGEGESVGLGQVYTEEFDEQSEASESTAETDENGDDSADDDTHGTMDRQSSRWALAADSEWLSIVEYESSFDGLSILAPPERGRYYDSYRTRGLTETNEFAIALRLAHTPADGTQEFVSAMASHLDDWRAVAQTDNVCTLYDWNADPRLWLATEYTDETLDDQREFPVSDAIWNAEQLAGAVATLHERGIVHAGIDPGNVAYYGNVLSERDRQPPLLDNVGLLHVLRYYGDPSMYLDPRYAAPEYYDRQFGRVDHATDIYQLGAVCYRLFTGRPPYTGAFDAVRKQILHTSPPEPSQVAELPQAVDDIVGKAMAKQKLARYETVAHLTQELRTLRKAHNDNGG